ncbi:hypothetical protein [Mycobacterium sp.]|uniref:hypothetical protein n=1 Tax=Mycobacterium sp. TaxID=1785 RepID=UPI00261364A5|nr:hypothetical protein [Mycobacterium sp.]
MTGLLEASVRRHREALAEQAVVMRTAQHGEAKHFRSLMDDLTKDAIAADGGRVAGEFDEDAWEDLD